MSKNIILGIETSCDETSVAVLEQVNGRIQILSNITASSALIQSKYGGIIPEQAAREQLKSIIPVITEALAEANISQQDLDAIAVTQGPGLIGSLLVGVETAKVLATIWEKPIIPINHLIGHFSANWIDVGSEEGGRRTENLTPPPNFQPPTFPCIGLLVSGGHTDLVLFKNHGQYEYLGGTRDDAAGECFDKCARLLGLPYPGGPHISRLAKDGQEECKLPRPLINSKDFDFSFSGLKTAVGNLVKEQLNERSSKSFFSGVPETSQKNDAASESTLANLCTSIENAIVECLVKKTIEAAKCHHIEQIIVAGGVAANPRLSEELRVRSEELKIKLHIPPPILCTDNGAMIAAAGFFEEKRVDPKDLQANPNLSLAY